MPDACSISIPFYCFAQGGQLKPEVPIRINVSSNVDDEAFSLVIPRGEWAKLIRGTVTAHGWIEPLEG